LTQFLAGYRAAEYVIDHRDSAIDGFNVYEVGTGNLCTTLRESDIHCVGDYFGPSRFEDLTIAIFSGNVADYVHRFGLSGFVIRRGDQPMPPLSVATLWKQLQPLGFSFATIDNDYFVFLKEKKS
jgi:hypothetical protein